MKKDIKFSDGRDRFSASQVFSRLGEAVERVMNAAPELMSDKYLFEGEELNGKLKSCSETKAA